MKLKIQSLNSYLFITVLTLSISSTIVFGAEKKTKNTVSKETSSQLDSKSDEIQDQYLEKLKKLHMDIKVAAGGIAIYQKGLIENQETEIKFIKEHNSTAMNRLYDQASEKYQTQINENISKKETAENSAKDLKLDALKYYKGKLPIHLSKSWKVADEDLASYLKKDQSPPLITTSLSTSPIVSTTIVGKETWENELSHFKDMSSNNLYEAVSKRAIELFDQGVKAGGDGSLDQQKVMLVQVVCLTNMLSEYYKKKGLNYPEPNSQDSLKRIKANVIRRTGTSEEEIQNEETYLINMATSMGIL